jgi:hypothetical protein
MSGRILLAGLVFVIAAATINGQTKTSGTMQCQKPDPLYSLEVQDHPGHVMLLQKAICSYTTSNEIGGDKAKDSYGVSMADATATHAVASGTHVVSYESGDKTFSSFRGTANGSDGKFAGNQ